MNHRHCNALKIDKLYLLLRLWSERHCRGEAGGSSSRDGGGDGRWEGGRGGMIGVEDITSVPLRTGLDLQLLLTLPCLPIRNFLSYLVVAESDHILIHCNLKGTDYQR